MYFKNKAVVDQLGVREYLLADTARSALFFLFQSLFESTKRREVVVPSFCCESVLLPVIFCGGVPKLVDVSLENYSVSLDIIEKILNENTAAIIVPHMFGISAYSDRLFHLYEKHQNIFWVDDACQTFLNFDEDGRQLGRQLDFGLISFDPSKPLHGHMGAVLLNSSKLSAQIVISSAIIKCDNSGDKGHHHELKRSQALYFGHLISMHRELEKKATADLGIIEALKPLFSTHISPTQAELTAGFKSLDNALNSAPTSSFFNTFLNQLGSDSPNYTPFKPKRSDKLWRLPILLENERHQRPLSHLLRTHGIQVSNHYFALSLLFPDYAVDCAVSEDISSRILNIWFNSKDEALIAAKIIREYFI
jgi:dTDP-4-amino-4,6-dideoxygalactose transaminase